MSLSFQIAASSWNSLIPVCIISQCLKIYIVSLGTSLSLKILCLHPLFCQLIYNPHVLFLDKIAFSPLTLTTTCGKITIWLHTWYSAAGTFKIIPVTAQTTVTEVISAALEKFGLKVCLEFQCVFSSIYGYFPSLLPFFPASSLPQFPFIFSWLFPNPSVLSVSFFIFSFLPPLL